MADMNDMNDMTDNNTELQHTPEEAQQEESFSQPQGRYDNLINLIRVFPLRFVLVPMVTFTAIMLQATMSSGNNVEAALLAFWLLPIMVIAGLGELMFGKVSKAIKDMLIGLVMRAEENAREL